MINMPNPLKKAGKYIMTGADAVTDFVGARGIAEQYGSSLARTGLKLTGNEKASQLVENPSFRKVLGSAIQTGANFIPGAGVGAGLATKVAVGAGTGYAFDVGSNLQMGKRGSEAFAPKIGTAVGAGIPVLGKILGLTTKNVPAWASKKLEDVSLRLSPVERQNLERKGTDIISYLSKNKVSGNPGQRYTKVVGLYNKMENTVQKEIDKAPVFVKTAPIIAELNQIARGMIDDPELADEASRTVAKTIQNIAERGDEITVNSVNRLKRNYMNRAFAKNATDVVSESRLAIGATLNNVLRKNVPGLERLNKEYGLIIASKRALQKAMTRNQTGLTGKIAGMAVGGTLGNMVSPGVGAAAGIMIGPTIGRAVAGTQVRSRLGAGLQRFSEVSDFISKLPTDQAGNISKKIVLNYLSNLRQEMDQYRQETE